MKLNFRIIVFNPKPLKNIDDSNHIAITNTKIAKCFFTDVDNQFKTPNNVVILLYMCRINQVNLVLELLWLIGNLLQLVSM